MSKPLGAVAALMNLPRHRLGVVALALLGLVGAGACTRTSGRITDPKLLVLHILSVPELGADRAGVNVPLPVGQSRQYKVVDGYDTGIPGTTWAAYPASPRVASIDDSGLALCLTGGVATIQTRSRTGSLEGVPAETSLTCVAPTATLTTSLSSIDLKVGEGKSVIATVTNASGVALVQWSSSNPAVAAANPASVAAIAGGSPTTITGIKAGTADLIASYDANGTTLRSTVKVTVAVAALPTISVSPTSIDQLQVGQQIPVTVSVTNASGTSPVQWASADPSTVTVSPLSVAASATGSPTTFSGIKTGGPVNVVASYTANGTTVTATVAVRVIAPVGSPTIVVNPRTVSVSQGRSTTVSGVVANGLNVTDVTWSTRDASVASITSNGSRSVIINGLKAGSSTYVVGSYAYSGGTATDSALVTVTNTVPVTDIESQVKSIKIEPLLPNAAVGQQVQFRVRYYSASGAEINAEPGSTTTFSEDISAVAQIGATTGLLTVRGVGETPVQAAYAFPGRTTLVSTTTLNKI